MSEDKPEPRSLEEALLQATCLGPTNYIKTVGIKIIKDFLALKFQSAIAKHEHCENCLTDLFNDICQREFKEKPMTLDQWLRKK